MVLVLLLLLVVVIVVGAKAVVVVVAVVVFVPVVGCRPEETRAQTTPRHDNRYLHVDFAADLSVKSIDQFVAKKVLEEDDADQVVCKVVAASTQDEPWIVKVRAFDATRCGGLHASQLVLFTCVVLVCMHACERHGQK